MKNSGVTEDGRAQALPEQGAREAPRSPASMMLVGRRLLDIGEGAGDRDDADEEEKEIHGCSPVLKDSPFRAGNAG